MAANTNFALGSWFLVQDPHPVFNIDLWTIAPKRSSWHTFFVRGQLRSLSIVTNINFLGDCARLDTGGSWQLSVLKPNDQEKSDRSVRLVQTNLRRCRMAGATKRSVLKSPRFQGHSSGHHLLVRWARYLRQERWSWSAGVFSATCNPLDLH